MNKLSRILYAEDDDDIREIASLAMESIGEFTVEVCASGKDLLEKAVAFEPDLILLDVMMPDMDGPATLARIKEMEKLSGVPVAFMTAKVQPQEVENLLALGAVGVIAKPFDPMTLADQIREVWNRAK